MAVELITYPTNREDAAEDLYSLLMGSKFRDGVYKGWLNDFAVIADSDGVQVKVKTGQVLIGGFDAHVLTQQTMTLSAAHSSNPRIDRVVLRLDRTDPATIYLDVKEGTPASTPSVPALTSTSTITELPIAQVRVNAGVSTINTSNLTDERTYTATRGHGVGTTGQITGTTSSVGTSPNAAPVDHSHAIDVVALQRLFIPAGTIWMTAFSSSTPSGWLPCDGRVISRGGYSALFSAIGTIYGVGNNQSTFGIPDYRNYVPRGAGGNQSVGQVRGSDNLTLTPAQLPMIDPSVDGDTGNRVIVTGGGPNYFIPNIFPGGSPLTVTISDIDEFGGNQSHSIEQASKGVAFIIKAH